MENATKALLIAAAVLIAIILISLGLAVVRNGQEAVGSADMTEAQVTAFNSKFTAYEGTNVPSSKVSAMLDAVFSHNNQATKKGENTVTVVDNTSNGMGLASNAKSVPQVKGASYFSVMSEYDDNGLVTKIHIQTAGANNLPGATPTESPAATE